MQNQENTNHIGRKGKEADCSTYEAMLSDYMLQLTSAEDTARIEKHLRECSSCRAEFQAREAMVAHLSELETVAPPVDFMEKLHNRLLQEEKAFLPAARERKEVPSFLRKLADALRAVPRSWQIGAPVLAGVLVIAVISTGIFSTMEPPSSDQEGQSMLASSSTPVPVPGGAEESSAAPASGEESGSGVSPADMSPEPNGNSAERTETIPDMGAAEAPSQNSLPSVSGGAQAERPSAQEQTEEETTKNESVDVSTADSRETQSPSPTPVPENTQAADKTDGAYKKSEEDSSAAEQEDSTAASHDVLMAKGTAEAVPETFCMDEESGAEKDFNGNASSGSGGGGGSAFGGSSSGMAGGGVAASAPAAAIDGVQVWTVTSSDPQKTLQASGFANRAEKDGKTYILILSEQEFEQFREYLKNGSADESVEFSGSEPADSDAGTEPGSYRIEIIEE